MVHIGGGEGRIAGATHSLVDYNRAGTPLIELVTKPDLRTPEEARLFMQKLRQIYLAIGISDCSMEEGSLRCDGNVSPASPRLYEAGHQDRAQEHELLQEPARRPGLRNLPSGRGA